MITLPTGTHFEARTINGQRVRVATAYPRQDMWERIEAALSAPDPATRRLLGGASLPITLWHSYDGRLDILMQDSGFALLENGPKDQLAALRSAQKSSAGSWWQRLLQGLLGWPETATPGR
jgi:hypothetical protein